MHQVRAIEYVSEHKLLLAIEDGSVKLVDLEPYVHGDVFEPLEDPAYFSTARVGPGSDTIVWDSGADFPPDFLYDIGRDVVERRHGGRPICVREGQAGDWP